MNDTADALTAEGLQGQLWSKLSGDKGFVDLKSEVRLKLGLEPPADEDWLQSQVARYATSALKGNPSTMVEDVSMESMKSHMKATIDDELRSQYGGPKF